MKAQRGGPRRRGKRRNRGIREIRGRAEESAALFRVFRVFRGLVSAAGATRRKSSRLARAGPRVSCSNSCPRWMRKVVSKNMGQRAGRFERRPRPWRTFLNKPGSKTRTPVNSRSSSWSSSPQVAGFDLKCPTMTSEKLCPFLFSLASVSYASVVTDIVIVAMHSQYTECSRLASKYHSFIPVSRLGR